MTSLSETSIATCLDKYGIGRVSTEQEKRQLGLIRFKLRQEY